MLRKLSLLVVLAACASLLGGAHSARAQTATSWCAGHPSLKTCIISATYDGSALTSSDPNYDIYASYYKIPGAGAHTVQWLVSNVGGGDLSAALGHTFSVTIQTQVNPREMDGFGAAMTYDRSGPTSGEYQVTFSGQPVAATDQTGCTFPAGGPTCTPVAPGSSAILQGEISDYDYTAYNDLSNYPAGFVNSFDGMVMYTNIAETSLPPNLIEVDGQNELELDMTDHHYEHDGSTLVHGDFYLRIPAAFLSTYWGINDPNTLSTDGLAASIGAGGGTLTVTVEPSNAAVDVTVSHMTFSHRKLKIKLGHVTPRAPQNAKAHRTSRTTAKVTFTKAKTRGQKVTGYKLTCKATSGATANWTSRSKHSPLVVAGLVPGQGYGCKLRARSKAGYGLASKKFSIPR